MSATRGTGFLGIVLSAFLILSIVDSIVHLVKEVDYQRNNEKNELKSIFTIVLMILRMLSTIQFLLFTSMSLKYKISENLIIMSSIINSLILIIVMILSCFVIDFKESTISLICHIITCYLSFVILFKLLFIKFEHKISLITRILKIISNNVLAISTLVSVIIAIVIGIILRDSNPGWNERSIKYLGFIGEIFLRMLKCLVLPLIFTSLVFAMGDIDTKLFGKIGFRTVSYYLGTTVLAIILGIILVVSIEPGTRGQAGKDSNQKVIQDFKVTTEDTILDLIRNLFPDNIVEACFATYRTLLSNDTEKYPGFNSTDIRHWKITSEKTSGTNILGIVVFAVVLGVIIGQMKEEAKPLVNFFRALNNAMMGMTVVVINFTPIAVLFLVLPQILDVKELSDLLGSVGFYTITVLLGLFIHGLILLPLSYFIITRKNPFTLIVNLSDAIMTAFGTSSSTATMPITFKCLEENMRFDKRIVRFCIPVGATINMDGTALYEAVAAIFIAQYRGLDLDFVKIIIIAITATAASIGAAGIPQAGLVTMVIVLNAVGLPTEDSALIFIIDWLIDRFRTVINVLGDSFGAGIVFHLSKDDIKEFDAIDPDNTTQSNPEVNQEIPSNNKL